MRLPGDNPWVCLTRHGNASASPIRSTRNPAVPSPHARHLTAIASLLRHPFRAGMRRPLRHVRDSIGTLVYAYCLMPDHVHLLLGISPVDSLPRVVGRWKSLCAKSRRAPRGLRLLLAAKLLRPRGPKGRRPDDRGALRPTQPGPGGTCRRLPRLPSLRLHGIRRVGEALAPPAPLRRAAASTTGKLFSSLRCFSTPWKRSSRAFR